MKDSQPDVENCLEEVLYVTLSISGELEVKVSKVFSSGSLQRSWRQVEDISFQK